MGPTDRLRWVRALTTAGWVALVSYLGIIAIEVRRAAAITTSRFEDGVWGQRIEIVSFVTLPQNIAVLMLPVATAVTAAVMLAGVHPDDRGDTVWLTRLTTVTGGLCVVAIFLALLGIGGIPFRYADPLADLGALVGRLSGIAMAAGALRLLRETG
ncbi:MAG: hypothetical protein EBS20_08145 [Actinobacteria bacterium]|nr:hypothetical protein [Actinomycetota bacterium]